MKLLSDEYFICPECSRHYKWEDGVTGLIHEYHYGSDNAEEIYNLSIEPWQVNISTLVDFESKWINLVDKDTPIPTPDTEEYKNKVGAFEGAGYVNFEGHGNPISWATHWAEPPGWTSGLSITDFRKLSNGDKLPVVIIGGCHNALFNVSMLRILLTRKDHNYYWVWYPTPVCFSWGLCILPQGGAIASTGCTGLGFAHEAAVGV